MEQRATIITNVISRTLAARGWTDGDLARRTGLSRTRINRLKNRRACPTVSDALLIAAALNLRVTELFSDHLYHSRPDLPGAAT